MMATGRGSMLKRSLAVFLFAGIIATIVAVCVVYIPKTNHGQPPTFHENCNPLTHTLT
jgi:hypothetical protein